MNVRVSRSALEKTIRMLLEQDAPSAATPDPGAPPAESPASPAPEKKDIEKSEKERFTEKVRELQKMKNGETFSVGDRKFQKRSGAFYLSGAADGLTQEQLLALIKPESREDVEKKLNKSRKEGASSAGVTIAGDQFITSADRSATFKYGSMEGGPTTWVDADGIPIEIIAQYFFEEVEGISIGSQDAGAYAADVLGPMGVKVLVYRSNEVMVVIDPSEGNLHIMSAEFNDYDPLAATKSLLSAIGLADKFGDAPGRNKKQPGVSPNAAEMDSIRAGFDSYLKPDGSGEVYGVPIANIQLGDLQKAIGSVRTIFGKFFDLFSRDDIKMNFKVTRWGPSMTRTKVFGGDAFEGGTGALTLRARQRLMSTGLFREENLPDAGVGTYIVNTSERLNLAYLLNPGAAAPKVIVTPMIGGTVGASVEGLANNYGVLYNGIETNNPDSYKNTYSDAYFLFMKGALSAEEPVEPEESKGEAAKEEKGDPLEADCAKNTGIAIGSTDEFKKSAALFVFAETDYLTGVPGFDAAAYIKDVAGQINKMYTGNKAAWYDTDANRKVEVTLVGTADQKGQDANNMKLSANRIAAFRTTLNTELSTLGFPADKLNITEVSVGETYWEGISDKESEEKRKYKRFVKAYWCGLPPNKAKITLDEYLAPVVKAAPTPGAAGETGSSTSSVRSGKETLTPEKITAALPKVSAFLESINGLTLTDGTYIYQVDYQNPGAVKISLGPNNLNQKVWSRGKVGDERWMRFVQQLANKKRIKVLVRNDATSAKIDGYDVLKADTDEADGSVFSIGNKRVKILNNRTLQILS